MIHTFRVHAKECAIYPTCCTSAYCGKTDCSGCPNEPVLAKFRAWVAFNDAYVADPVWSPNVYVAATPVHYD